MAPALFGLVGYRPDGFPDYGFRSFEKQLKFVERLRRQVAKTGSNCAEDLQTSHEDGE